MASLNREAPAPPDGFVPPEGLVQVAAFDSLKAANEAGLAILAMGRAYWTFRHEGIIVLCVPEAEREAVRRELEAVDRLSRGRRGESAIFAEYTPGWTGFVLYALLLIGFFAAQGRTDLSVIGRMDAQALLEGGEWWRAVTPLMLHADIVHLVSNLVAGIGFGLFATRFFGSATGWLLVLLSGAFGNLLNAWVHYPEPHLSIGASTAVFGAVGLLTGIGIWAALAEPRTPLSLPRWWVPLFGGLTLLGWLGVGDYRVDVAAHISGFLCGTVLGLLGAFGRKWIPVLQRRRRAVGAAALLVVAAAWVFAFAARP